MDSTKRPAAPRLADPLLDVAEHLGQAEQPVMAPPPLAPPAVARHYDVIAGYLSAHDRASLMQTQRAANTVVSQVPFPLSNLPMAVKPDRGDHAASEPAGSPGPAQRRVSYQAFAHLLSSQDRARLMRTERRAYVQISAAVDFPEVSVSMRDISTQLHGFAPVGMHGTSAADAPSLYRGITEPPQAQRTFNKDRGGQLGPGFYITEGFGPGEMNAAMGFARTRAGDRASTPTILRAHIKGREALKPFEATGDKRSPWWPKTTVKAPDYLSPPTAVKHSFVDGRTGKNAEVIKETGADIVSAPLGALDVYGGPMPETYDGHYAKQVKLNWHALKDLPAKDAFPGRPGAQVIVTPHDTRQPLPPAFLVAIAARRDKKS